MQGHKEIDARIIVLISTAALSCPNEAIESGSTRCRIFLRVARWFQASEACAPGISFIY